MDRINERYFLVGDEECGVDVNCNGHWRDGMPIIRYERNTDKPLYHPALVTTVDTINGLLEAINEHEKKHHSEDN